LTQRFRNGSTLSLGHERQERLLGCGPPRLAGRALPA